MTVVFLQHVRAVKSSRIASRATITPESIMAMRRLLVAAQYAAALECARRPAIARITAAATGCVTIKANAADVPMLGRFARNEGAKEFVGDWRLETTTGAKG